MKKIFLSLLMALTVVMSVAPLTAFAETVPEEYIGSYEGKISGRDVSIYVFEDTGEWEAGVGYVAKVDIESLNFHDVFSFWYSTNDDGVFFGRSGDGGGRVQIIQEIDNFYEVRIESNKLFTCISGQINKVSDSTNSTLSTGSNWIIPVVTGVLALGAVVYIGKRKSRKDNE